MGSAISVVLPAFDEGADFQRTLDRINEILVTCVSCYPNELIVVDDGSRDASVAIIDAFAASHPRVRVLRHERNRGLAAALRTGLGAARHPYIVCLDADLSYSPDLIETLAERLIADDATIALASPYMRGGKVSNVPLVRLLASRIANGLFWWFSGRRISTFTGMVRAYRTEFVGQVLQNETVGEFNSWMLAEALQRGEPIVEVPAHLCWPPARRQGASRMPLRKLIQHTMTVVRTIRHLQRATSRLPVGRWTQTHMEQSHQKTEFLAR